MDKPQSAEVEIWRAEKVALVNYLTAPAVLPNGGQTLRGQATRKDRQALRRALAQVGCLEVWKAATEGRNLDLLIPEVEVHTVNAESIDLLLDKLLLDMSNAQSLNLGDLEDRLEDARAGRHEVPAEARAKAASGRPKAPDAGAPS
jgi:hypothetical protein